MCCFHAPCDVWKVITVSFANLLQHSALEVVYSQRGLLLSSAVRPRVPLTFERFGTLQIQNKPHLFTRQQAQDFDKGNTVLHIPRESLQYCV